MNREEIQQAIHELSDDEKIALMKEVGPAICKAVMSRPDAMRAMMPMCREMMSNRLETMARMCETMQKTTG